MANEMLVAALAYAQRGWPIFPVRADKTPFTKHGVQDATTDPKKIEEMWARWPHANIALNVGEAGMMVLDLDPGHKIEELKANVGPIPDTALAARTPRGGRHLYFALANGEIVAASASKLAPHVDVRSFHSYVLLPPSQTKDGSYTWSGEGKPAFRTDDLLRLANAGRERHKDHDLWIIESDLPDNIQRAIQWLSKEAKVAIEGQGGDQCCYNTAAMCKSYGISEALARELMWEHWNPRCIPPWSADETDHFDQKIENGYSYNTSPPGNVTPAYKAARSAALFKAVQREELEEGNQWTRGRFRLVDRDGMEGIKAPLWLFEDFLPMGAYAMIYGAQSTYKTFIALDIALTIAAGIAQHQVWPGLHDLASGPVAFVAGEGRSQMLKRVRAWEKLHYGGMRVKDFKLIDPVPNITEDPELFLALLEDGSRVYSLVVIDTVGRAMQGVNENAQEYASAFTRLVEYIQTATGATVLALHHTGKDDSRGARGSSVFGADVDTLIHIKPSTHPLVVMLDMVKQKDAEAWPKPKLVRLEETPLSLSVKSLVAMPPREEEEQEIVTEEDEHILDMMDIVEVAALEFLAENPLKAYSTRALATAIAADDKVDLQERQLRAKYLPALRGDKSRAVRKCYRRHTEKWRYFTKKEG